MTPRFIRWLAALALFGAGARAEGVRGSTPGPAVSTFRMAGAYFTQRSAAGGECSTGPVRDIVGHEPHREGRFPLFVYLTGTTMKFNGLEAQTLTRGMAERGFVAAAVDYDNASYPYCSGMESKARCVFDEQLAGSAVRKLCARENVDCGLGIVVSGFSQGANLAALAGNYHRQVRAAYLLGHGDRPNNLLDVARCADDGATKLLPAQMRSVNGEHDGFFGMKPEGVRKQLEKVVGVRCEGSLRCEQANGSGWIVVADRELADGAADHCYFFHRADGYCAKYEGLDPGWAHGTLPWSLAPNLDWLAAQVGALVDAPVAAGGAERARP